MKHSQDNTPPAGVTTLSDVVGWHSSLRLLHARLASHFARPEPFQRALRFVQGILSTVERKNSWQLAEQAREATPYGMQRLLSQAVWDVDGVRDDIRTFALQQVGSSPVIVAIDETGFLKRGKHSAGGGRAALRPDWRSAQLPGGRLPLAGYSGRSYPHRPGAVCAC
jgi:DDE superfamily endonuclease